MLEKASWGMSRDGRAVRLQAQFLTINWRAGLINQAVSLNDTIGLLGLSPGHIDRGGGQLTEVNVAGSSWCFWRGKREEI